MIEKIILKFSGYDSKGDFIFSFPKDYFKGSRRPRRIKFTVTSFFTIV